MTTQAELVKYDDIRNALIDMAEAQSVSSDDVQRDIVQRILDAKTIEEAAQSFEATSAQDVEGVPLTVHGIAWLKSSYKEGPPVYALIDCTPHGSKQRLKVSMGGRSAMAFLLWTQHHKAMPFDVVFSRSDPTEEGSRYWKVNLPTGGAHKAA